jgi:hypothetical protein
LYQALLRNSSFFDLLLRFDEDLAEEARQTGCACGGALHRANYARKPCGGPVELADEHAVRFSFCCGVEGCRRRATPPSLRFLGRRVFLGVVVVLLPVLRDGPTPRRLDLLCAEFAVSRRTLGRWIRWWRETFAASRFWRASQGLFAQPVASQALPSSLLLAFGDLEEPWPRVLAMMRFLAPITSGKGLAGLAF